MAKTEKRKPGGGKLSRSQTVTVRLDPKLRYLAELAARKQRRTLSSFIEWAIEESLNRVVLYEGGEYSGDDSISVAEDTSRLWDVDEAERFARLAICYDDLLTHEEQVLWKVIKDSGLMWEGGYNNGSAWEWHWDRLEREVFPILREHWELFNEIANGGRPRSELPKWGKQPKSPAPAPAPDADFDDDIPF